MKKDILKAELAIAIVLLSTLASLLGYATQYIISMIKDVPTALFLNVAAFVWALLVVKEMRVARLKGDTFSYVTIFIVGLVFLLSLYLGYFL